MPPASAPRASVAIYIIELGVRHIKSVMSNFVVAYDFETFAKSATESGLNTSDRSLPVTMNVKRNFTAPGGGGTTGIRYDTYAMCDCIIYISQNGEIFTRI